MFLINISLCLYFVFIILLLTGFLLLKNHCFVRWNLIRRLNLRNEFKNNLKNIEKWREFSPKNGSFLFFIIDFFKKNRTGIMEQEIYEAISFLRNITSIGHGKRTSTDYIIQKLIEQEGILKPIYQKMLTYLRINRKEEAVGYFSKKVGGNISKDYARLLIQWDQIDPSDLTETLLSYSKNIKEIRVTNQKRKDEIISDLIYFPVVLNILVLFVNFIYVAYFIDQREMLKMFF